MKTGQMVLLIAREDDMPPIGTVGSVVEPEDRAGDVLVAFPGFPCPVPPDDCWFAHKTWLVPLDPDLMERVVRELVNLAV